MESCDTACQAHGLVCTKQGFENHHSNVDSSEEVLNLIKTLGGEMSAEYCILDNSRASPQFNSVHCLYSNAPDLFECSKLPKPIKDNKQRLCYCQTT